MEKQKPKRGRPPLPNARRAHNTIHATYSDIERAIVGEAARVLDQEPAVFVRFASLLIARDAIAKASEKKST